jgi:hypothetical protein
MPRRALRALRMTWWDLGRALDCARYDAAEVGRRMRVIRENGHDEWGPHRFRILPADECSCYWWTENVGPGLDLPCAEQHHSCPVHPMEVAEPCS